MSSVSRLVSENTYGIHVFGCVCSTWISIFTSIGLSSAKMGSYCPWVAAIPIPGAEWWAQPFGKSIPFLSWVPFISEITMYKAVLFLIIIFAVIPTVSFNVHNVYKVVQGRK